MGYIKLTNGKVTEYYPIAQKGRNDLEYIDNDAHYIDMLRKPYNYFLDDFKNYIKGKCKYLIYQTDKYLLEDSILPDGKVKNDVLSYRANLKNILDQIDSVLSIPVGGVDSFDFGEEIY